jgi:hypothetical protein
MLNLFILNTCSVCFLSRKFILILGSLIGSQYLIQFLYKTSTVLNENRSRHLNTDYHTTVPISSFILVPRCLFLINKMYQFDYVSLDLKTSKFLHAYYDMKIFAFQNQVFGMSKFTNFIPLLLIFSCKLPFHTFGFKIILISKLWHWTQLTNISSCEAQTRELC